MIRIKIGCIKINLLQDCSSFNIGTVINTQNKSHTQNYTYEQPKQTLPPTREEERRGEQPERPEAPVRQPPVTPPRPGPVSPP
jgi:hypothetical protein